MTESTEIYNVQPLRTREEIEEMKVASNVAIKAYRNARNWPKEMY
ncbi:hypothetical protein [Virgibacillus alimentarius]|nr:hypothetical protein [Virgibacillus alimentarius]